MSATRTRARQVRRPRARDHARDARDEGSVAVWLLLVVPTMLLSAGLVVDGGQAMRARQEATGLAAEAARYAVDQIDTGRYRSTAGPAVPAPGTAQAAACGWVAQARPDAVCQAVPAADGVVEVSVTVTYTPVMLPSAVGPLTATGHGTARPAVGVDQEEDSR